MKQLAWLHSTPKKKKQLHESTEAKNDMTRMQTLQAAGSSIDLPDPGAAAHLVGVLFDVGPIGYGAMAAVPLSWPEINAWQQATGVELASWEARAIRRLSGEYLTMLQQAEDPACPAPWVNQADIERRAAVADKVRAVFGSAAATRRH